MRNAGNAYRSSLVRLRSAPSDDAARFYHAKNQERASMRIIILPVPRRYGVRRSMSTSWTSTAASSGRAVTPTDVRG